MMNGCISHIYYTYWVGAFTLQRQISPRNKPHPGQTNENFFLKKPLLLNAILNKSTRCLIMCNIHVRVAIRENPDSHNTIDTTASCGQAFIQMKHWIYASMDILVILACFHIPVNDIDCGSVLHTTVPLCELKFIWVLYRAVRPCSWMVWNFIYKCLVLLQH